MSEDDKVMVVRAHDGRPVAVPLEVVVSSERPYRAYVLHQAGHPWETIALTEGYPDWKAARADVKRYLDIGASVLRDYTRVQMVELELARLNAYSAALWNDAMKGSVPAINTSLGVSSMRIKLLRLDQDIADEDEMTGRTVVVGNDDDDYTAGLEAAADGKGHH